MRAAPLPAMPLLAPLLALAMLTATDERRLRRVLVCPERLADDEARLRNIGAFMRLYAEIAPASRMGERMETRARLLAIKGCRLLDDAPNYTFPES